MALISCPECKKEGLSENASFCPHCGFNMTFLTYEQRQRLIEEEKRKEAKAKRGGFFLLILILLVCFLVVRGCSTGEKLMDQQRKKTGTCDVCGAKAVTKWLDHEVCLSCYYGILNTKVD